MSAKEMVKEQITLVDNRFLKTDQAASDPSKTSTHNLSVLTYQNSFPRHILPIMKRSFLLARLTSIWSSHRQREIRLSIVRESCPFNSNKTNSAPKIAPIMTRSRKLETRNSDNSCLQISSSQDPRDHLNSKIVDLVECHRSAKAFAASFPRMKMYNLFMHSQTKTDDYLLKLNQTYFHSIL